MKTTKQLSIIVAIILLSFSINSCRDQSIRVDHTITLYVDTENINQHNLDTTCKFLPSTGESIKDYTTLVAFGDEISWKGESKNGRDIVKIKKIKYERDAEILTTKVKRNRWFTPKVYGKVKKEPDFKGMAGDKGHYSIEFKIKGDSINSTRFIIDPKLQVNRTR